jgi:hypothetical protein
MKMNTISLIIIKYQFNKCILVNFGLLYAIKNMFFLSDKMKDFNFVSLE